MRAAVYHRYGPPSVVRVEQVPTPLPGPHEVRVRVRATTESSGDVRARSLKMPAGFGPFARPVFGFFGPRKRILGTELAGVVDAVGSGVTRFREGDRVFAFPGFELGAHAEWRVLPEGGRVLPVPTGMSFEQAAALSFGGCTALHYLRDRAGLKAGERVLIIGALGAVGSAATQLARSFGARVTAVTSGGNREAALGLGAERVIDYTQQSFVEPGVEYDVIFDTVGATSFSACKAALSSSGRLLLSAADLYQWLGAGWATRGSQRRVLAGPSPERLEHLRTLRELAEAGQYRPLVDRVYPLESIAEAHAYVDGGHKRGSVVITV